MEAPHTHACAAWLTLIPCKVKVPPAVPDLGLQGFSIGWWKTKHNTHHAAPNALESGSKAAVDPDIDTLPLLAWSTEMLDSLPSTASRTMIRCQQYLFFPVLLVARMSWCQQSIGHALGMVQVGPPWPAGVCLQAASCGTCILARVCTKVPVTPLGLSQVHHADRLGGWRGTFGP